MVAVVVEVEALVEALVDEAPGVVGRGAVELGGVACPVEAFGEALAPEFQLVAGVGELGLDAGAFELDGVTALLDLCSAELAVGGEVDEAFFAGFQLGELARECGVQVLG